MGSPIAAGVGPILVGCQLIPDLMTSSELGTGSARK
jgi:hypothetical protein